MSHQCDQVSIIFALRSSVAAPQRKEGREGEGKEGGSLHRPGAGNLSQSCGASSPASRPVSFSPLLALRRTWGLWRRDGEAGGLVSCPAFIFGRSLVAVRVVLQTAAAHIGSHDTFLFLRAPTF